MIVFPHTFPIEIKEKRDIVIIKIISYLNVCKFRTEKIKQSDHMGENFRAHASYEYKCLS